VPGAAVVDFFELTSLYQVFFSFSLTNVCVEPLAAAASRRPSLARQERVSSRAERLFSFRVASYVTVAS
jgi:hypothetical protein